MHIAAARNYPPANVSPKLQKWLIHAAHAPVATHTKTMAKRASSPPPLEITTTTPIYYGYISISPPRSRKINDRPRDYDGEERSMNEGEARGLVIQKPHNPRLNESSIM